MLHCCHRRPSPVAANNNAVSVERILLRVGGLSGVEPPLLEHAFEIARMGTVAEKAELGIEDGCDPAPLEDLHDACRRLFGPYRAIETHQDTQQEEAR